MDIQPDAAALKVGGLHVIIPFPMQNKRVLDQAIDRSGRQGQPGSATIYRSSSDRFLRTPDFNPIYGNLMKLQDIFAQHVKNKWSWACRDKKKYGVPQIEYPFGISTKAMLELTAKVISDVQSSCKPEKREQVFCDAVNDMIMMSWGLLYNKISSNPEKYQSLAACECEYQNFLQELSVWVPDDCKAPSKGFAYFAKEILKKVD